MKPEPTRPQTRPAAETSALSRRKEGHVDACLDPGVERGVDSFQQFRLRYNCLPELALDEVSTACEFGGRPIAAPVIISCMTGGAGERLARLNRNLALGAEALGLPLGLGSGKVGLLHDAARESFQVRDLAPSVPLIANLGLVSFNYELDYADVQRVIEWMQPDVFGLHLNALQEVVQEGGDTDFRGLLGHLEAIREQCGMPLYIKECGAGIAPEQVALLTERGVDYVDVSGNDGTSWAAVEARLSADPSFGELFRDVGLPTAWILDQLAPAQVGAAQIVAGGGIRNGLQAAKALALGARYVSLARPFLVAADDSPEAVIALGERLIRELRTAMFLVGARTPADLHRGLLIQP